MMAPLSPKMRASTPGEIPNGHEAGLNGSDDAVGELCDEYVTVVDVHGSELVASIYHSFGDEVAHGSHDAGVVGSNPPAADVDDGPAVALKGDHLYFGLVFPHLGAAQRRLWVNPLGVLLVAVEDVGFSYEPLVDERPGVLHARGVAEGESQLGLESFALGEGG